MLMELDCQYLSYTVVIKKTFRIALKVRSAPHSRPLSPYFYRVFTVLQVNHLSYYSRVIKARMNC